MFVRQKAFPDDSTSVRLVLRVAANVTDVGNPRQNSSGLLESVRASRAEWRELSAHSEGRY